MLADASTVMDAAGVPMALLDASGRLREVNRAWSLHVQTSAGLEGRLVTGAELPAVCRDAAEAGDAEADLIAGALHAVLSGARESIEVSYRSSGCSEDRWMQVRFGALVDAVGERGAVATLEEVTDRWQLALAIATNEDRDRATGLPGRAAVEEQLGASLAAARREGGRVAVAVVVLAGLDEIAHDYGLPVADRVVVQAVGRMRRAVRSDDQLFRRADDQLVLLARGLGPNGFDALLRRLSNVLGEPFRLGGAAKAVAGYAAGALSSPASSVRSLLDEADSAITRALLEAPSAPVPAPHRWADVAVDPRANTTSTVGASLSDPVVAMEAAAEAIPLRYRPVVRLRDDAIVAMEVVGPRSATTSQADRRSHADRRLATTIEVAARVQRAIPEDSITFVVDLVAEQVSDPHFADGLRDLLDEAGLSPARLAIQVTEEDLSATPGIEQSLVQLKQVGVRLSVDDFGRGHCSLAELSRLPIDVVRADLGRLAAGPGEAAAMAAALAVAQTLGYRAIATGIDGDADLAELVRLRCAYAEGARWPDLDGVEEIEQVLTAHRARPARRLVSGSTSRVLHGAAEPQLPAPAAEELDAVFRALVHEVRTPLTVAMGWASMIESSEDEQSALAATSIRRAAERINRMLANLEDVRMIDQGSLALETRSLELRPVVEDVVAELREVMGIRVAVREDEGFALPVEADETRIGQVLINLIHNAAKFSTADHQVEVRLWADAAWAEVSVVDDGPGIAPDDLAVIFRKYGRGSTDRPGSGIGLYLARGIALAHGGELTYRRRWLRSGSVFTLRLPLSPR